jgi:hypothetical protein
MKRFLKRMSVVISSVLAVMLLVAMPLSKAQAQDDYVSYQTFYDELSPYGQWVNDPQYGNVWVPDVGNDFRPYYSRGNWVMTEYGNTWVSDYPWGWAPFHYGRWTYNPFYGWVWIPGNTWGPAWVSWRWGGGNCGWAPLGPGISISVGINNYSCPNDWWVFVGPQYLYQRNFHNYWRGPRYNTTYINNTTIINNTYNNTYVYGPRPRDVERVTNQRVNVHRVRDGRRGPAVVNNNTVNVYRPSVRNASTNDRPRNLVEAPRSIGSPQSVRNTRPEFRNMASRGDLRPVTGGDNSVRQSGGREQRFDGRGDRGQVRPGVTDRNVTDRPQRLDRPEMNRQTDRLERSPRTVRPQMEQQRIERTQQQQRPERQQMQEQRIERPQMQQRVERSQPQQRMERPQMQQRMERPQMQQRMERPQMQQRMERPQMQQRMERPQMQQRMERPQMQQRMERPQMQRMERSQPAPRPQPQQQSRPGGGSDRGNRR